MKYLEMFNLIEYALSALKYRERAQVSSEKVNEVKLCALQISKRVKDEEGASAIKLSLERLLIGLDTLSGINLDYLTEEMKMSLVSACVNLRNDIAQQCYAYNMDVPFEVNKTTIPLMRKVIQIATGGEYV